MVKRATGILTVLVAVLLLASCGRESATTKPARVTSNPPLASHVVIISIDGCRPDVLLRANTPNIRSLMAEGSFSMWARTTAVSITLPSHVSMMTGVTPERHGVTWNKDLPEGTQIYPAVPTLFDVAKKAGMTTGMAAGKSKFATLARPGSVDSMWIPETKTGEDAVVAQEAANILLRSRPNVMFVHFPSTDNVGHDRGWGTPEQLEAVERADEAVGVVVKAIKDAGIWEKTLLIVTADHGGAGLTHGADDPRSRHIPWIVVGPSVRKDFDLTRFRDLTINTEDTFATACYFLGLLPEGGIDGKPVLDIIQERELMVPTE